MNSRIWTMLVIELFALTVVNPSWATSKWSADLDHDGKMDEVIWTRKGQSDSFVVKLGKNKSYSVKVAQLTAKEKFCGTLQFKKSGEPGISARDYFQSKSGAEASQKDREKYASIETVEISFDIKSSTDWTEECYCTQGFQFVDNRFQSVGTACD